MKLLATKLKSTTQMKKTYSTLGSTSEGTSKNNEVEIERQMEIVRDLADITIRLNYLKGIISAKEISGIQIHFFADNTHKWLMQNDLPIVLKNELLLMLIASVELYEQDIQSLKNQF